MFCTIYTIVPLAGFSSNPGQSKQPVIISTVISIGKRLLDGCREGQWVSIVCGVELKCQTSGSVKQ